MTKREKLAYLRGYMNGLYMMSRFRLETCPDNREKAAKNIWDHYFRELYKALGLPPGTMASEECEEFMDEIEATLAAGGYYAGAERPAHERN